MIKTHHLKGYGLDPMNSSLHTMNSMNTHLDARVIAFAGVAAGFCAAVVASATAKIRGKWTSGGLWEKESSI